MLILKILNISITTTIINMIVIINMVVITSLR